MMIFSFGLCLTIGVLVGARFNALILIPGSIAAAASSVVIGLMSGSTVTTWLLLLFSLPFALQIGYLSTAFALAVIGVRRRLELQHG